MSNYGGYGSNGGGGYGQPNPYNQDGGRYNQGAGNPYSQQGGNPYAQQQPPTQSSYGGRTQQPSYDNRAQQPSYDNRTQQPSYDNRPQQGGRDNRYGGGRTQAPAASGNSYAGGNDMEMGPVNGQTSNGYNATPNRTPNAILEECRNVDVGITELQEHLRTLGSYQSAVLNDSDSSQGAFNKRKLDDQTAATMNLYKSLGARIKSMKQQRESGDPKNSSQVGMVDRKLKSAIRQYQQLDRDYRHDLSKQLERQYRIVRPDASEQEVREAVEDTSSNQIFSQALMTSGRQGQATSALQAVNNRHEAIKQIESQMIELAQLFQDLEAAIVQQEPAVEIIDQKAEDTQMNIGKGNEQLDQAVVKARSARKKKWICLGICVLIFLIIVAIIVVVLKATNVIK